MTADFGNFIAKTDEKQKTKDEMNPALIHTSRSMYFFEQFNWGIFCLFSNFLNTIYSTNLAEKN